MGTLTRLSQVSFGKQTGRGKLAMSYPPQQVGWGDGGKVSHSKMVAVSWWWRDGGSELSHSEVRMEQLSNPVFYVTGESIRCILFVPYYIFDSVFL